MKAANEHRSNKERRQTKQSVSFPLQDCNGELVTKEHRTFPERRAEGLELSESDLSKEEFNTFFNKFQENGNF